MPRITLSKNPSLQESVSAAHEALETGRTVRVGAQGNLEVADIIQARGGTFFGRPVRYLKNCFTPDRVRRHNHAVFAALNEQISREFGTHQRLNIRTVLRRANTNERFLQSIIDSVSTIRTRTRYRPACDLDEEARNTLRFGYADKITAPTSAQGQTASSAGVPITAREQLFWYNRTMSDLYDRFPKLRDVPAISSLDLNAFSGNPAGYQSTPLRYGRALDNLEFSPFHRDSLSLALVVNVNAGLLTPKQDCSGLIHHEYSHHLSIRIVPDQVWVPKLVEALKRGGIANARISFVNGKPSFHRDTAIKVAGIAGVYASTDPHECAAEILSWYMNPEYGKSVVRMPDYLEHWVTECFPMLDND